MVELDDVIESLEALVERAGLLDPVVETEAGRRLLTALADRECEGSRTAAAVILSNLRSVDKSRLFRAVVSLLGSLDEAPDPWLLQVLCSHRRPLLEAMNAAAVDPDLDRDALFATIAAAGVISAALELSEESSDASTSSALSFMTLVEPLLARLGERVRGFGLRLDAEPADLDSRHVGLRPALDVAALIIVRRLALARRSPTPSVEVERRRLLAAEDLAARAAERPGTCYLRGCLLLQALMQEVQGLPADYPS